MKRFLKFYTKDKAHVKMINSTEKGFELVILSTSVLNKLLEIIYNSEEKNDTIDVVWQMKFKRDNFMVYKNCTFSNPTDNYNMNKLTGKKIKVTCDSINFFSKSWLYKDKNVKKSKSKYKDAALLDRMLKIEELNVIGENE